MKPTPNPLLMCSALLAMCFASGCMVDTTNHKPHPAWPRPIHAGSDQQFEGVYRNRSLEGHTTGGETELYASLTSEKKPTGSRVEIQRSAAGNALDVRLLDDSGRRLASSRLQNGVDYRLAHGTLTLRGEELGWVSRSTNVGPFLSHSSYSLQLGVNGGLLGRCTEGRVGLLAFVFPFVDRSDEALYWPRLAPWPAKPRAPR